MKLSLAGFITCLIIIIVVVVLNSCAVCPHPGGPVNEKRVQRHDSRHFRASVVLKPGSEITALYKYERSVLVSIRRTQFGFKHLFISDAGDSIYKTFQIRFDIDSCYMVMKNI